MQNSGVGHKQEGGVTSLSQEAGVLAEGEEALLHVWQILKGRSMWALGFPLPVLAANSKVLKGCVYQGLCSLRTEIWVKLPSY